MLYDVDQAASKLNVSKMTIYNKIKLKEYKDKVIKKAGKTYIDDDLLNLIQDSLKVKSNIENSNIENDIKQETATDEEDLLNFNKDLIDALLEQLNIKDKQIEELNNRLEQEMDLHKNTQVLFRQQQDKPQNILQLEEHFKEFDEKLNEVREQMQQRKEKYDNEKSIFKKIFKK